MMQFEKMKKTTSEYLHLVMNYIGAENGVMMKMIMNIGNGTVLYHFLISTVFIFIDVDM